MGKAIDYIGILNYMKEYGGLKYVKPEKEGLSQESQNRFLEIKSKAQEAVIEMRKIVKLCCDKFGLDEKASRNMQWLDGSNTYVRKYLWAQMKYEEYMDNPISVSIFVDKLEDKNSARYHIALDLRDEKSDEEIFDQYHKFLDNWVYDPKSGIKIQAYGPDIDGIMLDEAAGTIKAKLNSGVYYKAQPCILQEYEDSLTNQDYEKIILDSVEAILPYYKCAVGIEK